MESTDISSRKILHCSGGQFGRVDKKVHRIKEIIDSQYEISKVLLYICLVHCYKLE
jgi:hypothetical protein